MLKKIIALEGSDGSGKGQIAAMIRKHAMKAGVLTEVIDKGDVELTEKLTAIINIANIQSVELSFEWDKQPHVLCRIAREIVRYRQAQMSSAQLVILDRYLMSTMAHAFSLGVEENSNLVKELILICGAQRRVDGVVHCWVPFEVGWERVSRDLGRSRFRLSRKEAKGESHNQLLYDNLERIIEQNEFGWIIHRVENTGSLRDMDELVKNELLDKLLS